VEQRVNAGKDSPVEQTRASVVLSNIRMLDGQARRDLEHARKQLAFFWGQEAPTFGRVAGDLYHVDPLPALDDLTKQLGHNPAYLRFQAQIDKSKAKVDLERAKANGDVTVAAGFRRFNKTNDNAIVFGVSIPLPISDRNQGAKQEAVYRLAQSRAEQKNAWLKLQSMLSDIYRDLANSHSQITSLNNDILPAAVEMFDAATKAYQEGKVDYLNVLDAQRTLFDVKKALIESLGAYHTAKTEIACCVGNYSQMIHIKESEQ